MNIYNFTCKIHGEYTGASSRQKCYKCVKETEICLICSKNEIYSNNICKECFDKLPCDSKINKSNKIFLLNCTIHGKYLANSPTSRCIVCFPENLRNKICDKCGIKFLDKRRFDTVVLSKYNFCNGYDSKLLTTYEKSYKPNKIYYLNCTIHGTYKSQAANCLCPSCLKERNKSPAIKLFEELCDNQHNKIESDLFLFPIDFNTLSNREYPLKTCNVCNRYFKPNSGSQSLCGKCHKILKCTECGYNFIKFSNFDKEIGCCSIACSNKKRSKLTSIGGNKTNNRYLIINPINFIPNHIEITENNINDFNISGIWYKYDELNKTLLDVCLTTNIMEEFYFHFNAIKNDKRRKYIEMSKIDNIKFYYFSGIDSWIDGLRKEFEFATANSAKYWSPAPGFQMKIYSNSLFSSKEVK